MSRKNKENSLKASNPRKLGSCGYANKMDVFERELEEVECLGIEPETANWKPRLIYFYMVRGLPGCEL